MLLEMDNADLLMLLEKEGVLLARIDEIVAVWNACRVGTEEVTSYAIPKDKKMIKKT